MRSETIAALTAINRRFYHERAEEFSETRERPWRGWEALFDRVTLPEHSPPTILDVGCGNGRFARFLKTKLGDDGFRYVGVDSSPLALEQARLRLGRGVELYEHDFLETTACVPQALSNRRFDFVALFGVLHHVPSREGRARLVRGLADHVLGSMAITIWLFERFERFRRKLVPWSDYLEATGETVDRHDLEPGDHLMTWGKAPVGFRYCHALSDDEESSLIEESGLALVERFEPENEPNRYVLLVRRDKC